MKKRKNKVAVISMARNSTVFIDKWISYYGSELGYENLYLFIDGMDQQLPIQASKINCFQIPHIKQSRSKGDRDRAKRISNFAAGLFERYQVVIALDIDEFLAVDPNTNMSLNAYFQQSFEQDSLSALGIDVIQHPTFEADIDWTTPVLKQRSFAVLSDRYTKPVVALKPVRWGAGFHRIKGKNFTIDTQLFLFHLGMADGMRFRSQQNSELIKVGWKGHFKRRAKSFEIIQKMPVQKEEEIIIKARSFFSKHRKWYAWNKPAPLKFNPVIEIPERFKMLL